MSEQCGDVIVLWPDVEAIDLHCELPPGHASRWHTDGPPVQNWWTDEGIDSHVAAGFSEAQWDEQFAMVARWGRTQSHCVDTPGTALGLLLEFSGPTEPMQAERRRFMNRLRASGILRDDPG